MTRKGASLLLQMYGRAKYMGRADNYKVTWETTCDYLMSRE